MDLKYASRRFGSGDEHLRALSPSFSWKKSHRSEEAESLFPVRQPIDTEDLDDQTHPIFTDFVHEVEDEG